MGQKVNQSIFRLKVNNSEWNYKYLEKNAEESSLFLYKTTQIIDYINNTFKFYNIIVHSCKIEYTKTSINISIYFFDLDFKKTETYANRKQLISFIISELLPISLNLYTQNSKINIKTKSLNEIFATKNNHSTYEKTIRNFKKFLKNKPYKSYKSLIKIMFLTVCEKNSAKLLADCIAIYINKHRKRHGYLLFILKKCLNILVFSKFSVIKGLKIEISGRINGAPRAKTKKIQIGEIPLQSFTSLINYHNATSYTLNGSFGIKVWICEK
jgi:ribosomal protein S3